MIREKGISPEGQRPEESRFSVCHPLHHPLRDVIADDVRDAAVVRAAEKPGAVFREDEIRRRAVDEIIQCVKGRIPRKERRDFHADQVLSPVDMRQGTDELRAVRRYVDVENILSVVEREYLVPFAVRVRDPHESRNPVEVADPPERTVRSVEREVTRPDVFHEETRRAAGDFIGIEVPPVVVVCRIEKGPARRIERKGRNIEEGAAPYFVQVFDGSRSDVNRRDVGCLPREINRHVRAV